MTESELKANIVDRLAYCRDHGIFDAVEADMHCSHAEAYDEIVRLRTHPPEIARLIEAAEWAERMLFAKGVNASNLAAALAAIKGDA